MSLFNDLIKVVYENPDIPVEMEFSNQSGKLANIWIEPSCESIELKKGLEYKIVSNDRFFRIEFDENEQVILYLQRSFGCKIYKRLASDHHENHNPWHLAVDTSDIQ